MQYGMALCKVPRSESWPVSLIGVPSWLIVAVQSRHETVNQSFIIFKWFLSAVQNIGKLFEDSEFLEWLNRSSLISTRRSRVMSSSAFSLPFKNHIRCSQFTVDVGICLVNLVMRCSHIIRNVWMTASFSSSVMISCSTSVLP